MIKMLIIGKNNQNQTTKNRGRYSGRAGLDPLTGLPDGQRPAKTWAPGIGVMVWVYGKMEVS
jgi:hypothetical protein